MAKETPLTTQANEALARLDRIFSRQQQAFALDPMPALEERKQHLKTPTRDGVCNPVPNV